MSPNEKLANVGEDFALEEGLPQETAVESSTAPKNSRLSMVSSKYDIDGDGKLDKAEQAMRDMDQSNRGFLTNDKVYKIVQEQLEMQQQMFNMKKVLIGLSIFTVVLALSNLGTAWAAAVLAKDTKVDSSGNMYARDGGRMVGTESKVPVFDAAPKEDDDRRELNLFDLSPNGNKATVPIAIQAELEACSAATIRIRHTCDNVVKFYHYDCDNNEITSTGNKPSYFDGTVTVSNCNGQTCDVSNLPCESSVAANSLAIGSRCFIDLECELNAFCRDGSTAGGGNPGTCDKKNDGEGCNTAPECYSYSCVDGLCVSPAGAMPEPDPIPVEGGGGTVDCGAVNCTACPGTRPSDNVPYTNCTVAEQDDVCSNCCYGGVGDCDYVCMYDPQYGQYWGQQCF